jgi:hypothetical protein
MRPLVTLLALMLPFAATSCTKAEREWMKPGERYTAEEFRRDHAACSNKGKLDEACMRGRGWVDVSPGRAEKAPEPDIRRPPPGIFR